MSQTRAQKKKKSKKKARERNLSKQRNMRHQAAPKPWRLDVFYNGKWALGMKEFSSWDKVEAFRDETEEQRKAGDEICAGRVVNLLTGKIDVEIKPTEKKVDPKDLDKKTSGAEEAKALKA